MKRWQKNITKAIQEELEKDIQQRKELGLELLSISDFIHSEIKEIYREILQKEQV